MKTVKSESTVKPKEWDTVSSETTVYHNFNVAETPAHKNDMGVEIPLMYQYDQEQYTREEYAEYRINQNTADIAYLSMMTDVELGGV